MPVDSNIAMGFKPVEVANPLDSAVKAMTMKNLLQENQSNTMKLNEEKRAYDEKQTLRDAYKNNTQAGPDGVPTIDRQGLMGDLMKTNPMLAQQKSLEFKQMDLDKLNQQHSTAKSILFGIDPANQASLDDAFAKAKQFGLPPLDGVLPKSVSDPSFQSALRAAQIKNLSAEEQIAQQNKQQEFAMQKTKNDLENKKLDVEMKHFDYTKQFEANQQVQQALESARQSPDAQQALKDVYAAKKVNTLVNQGRDEKGNLDPNKLNMTQVRLVVGEVGKIAQGGSPTMDETHNLTPGGVPQQISEAAEKFNNKPTAANAGAFVTSLQNYANSVAADGKQLLVDRAHKIVDQRKDDLGQKNYQNYKSNIEKLAIPDGETAGKGPAAKAPDKKAAAFSSDVTSYASKHGITPEQAAAIKAQRTKVAGP